MSNNTATLLGVLVHILDFVLVPLPVGRYFFAWTAHLALALHPTLVDIETKVAIHCSVVCGLYLVQSAAMHNDETCVWRFLQFTV